jgi:GNAT superfamily N-acetyltransferase
MISRFATPWRYLRERGLRATLAARVYSFEHYIVTHNVLASEASDHAGDVRFRLAGPSDLDRLTELNPYGRGKTDRKYVDEEGDWLFVAEHDDRIVATRRYGRVIRHPVVSRVVRLGGGQVWSADIFCVPEYRNQGIARYLGLFAETVLRSHGHTEVFGVMNIKNVASLRSVLRKGGRPVYYLSHLRLLSFERVGVSRTIPDRFVRMAAELPTTPGGDASR